MIMSFKDLDVQIALMSRGGKLVYMISLVMSHGLNVLYKQWLIFMFCDIIMEPGY